MTNTATDQDDETREGVEYRPDGSAWIFIDGTRYRLRRIRGREYRRLRDTLQDARDTVRAEQARLEAWADQLAEAVMARRKTDPTANLTAEERAQDSAESIAFARASEALMFGWWAECFAILSKDGTPVLDQKGDHGDEPDPDFDPYEDLPMWMGTAESVEDLFTHWRSVPSLSGGR